MRVVPTMRGAGQTAALRTLQVRDGSQCAGQPNGSNWLGYSAPYLAGESRFLLRSRRACGREAGRLRPSHLVAETFVCAVRQRKATCNNSRGCLSAGRCAQCSICEGDAIARKDDLRVSRGSADAHHLIPASLKFIRDHLHVHLIPDGPKMVRYGVDVPRGTAIQVHHRKYPNLPRHAQ